MRLFLDLPRQVGHNKYRGWFWSLRWGHDCLLMRGIEIWDLVCCDVRYAAGLRVPWLARLGLLLLPGRVWKMRPCCRVPLHFAPPAARGAVSPLRLFPPTAINDSVI